jgi:hypothetical protein
MDPDHAGGGGTFHGKRGLSRQAPSRGWWRRNADAAAIIARQTRWMVAAVMTSSDATAFLPLLVGPGKLAESGK